uniref:Uncharacterized protein n=1 Tax=Populus trichocarpa TaxID=3694 RepID=B9IIT3_POPTR
MMLFFNEARYVLREVFGLEKWTERQSLGYNSAFSSLQAKRPSEQNALRRLKALAYIEKQTRNPLSRITFLVK